MFAVTYNNKTDAQIGCHAKSRPSIPAPAQKVSITLIAGRDGSYFDPEDTVSDIVIPVTFSFRKQNKNLWHTVYRAIKAWLLTSEDRNILSFSDDPGFHYRVKNVQISSAERIAWTIGEVTAMFTCDGYTYLDSGDDAVNLTATLQNDHALCMPIYELTGNGAFTLTVNGNTMTGTCSSNLTIDTERMLALQSGATWFNTTVAGDYQGLWLVPGQNTLSITSGITCRIRPQWRCL